MTTFERRQRILNLLHEHAAVRVTELARLLNVSEGTIRNDLTALEESKRLTRVRGGATLTNNQRSHSPVFTARAQINAAAKQRIARWAADMIEDGDSILLDASTTVFQIVPHLQKLHNLIVVTNGIEAGLALAENPSNTVILIGGVLRPDGTSVTGHLSEKILKDLHIKTAFVSCSGFSIQAGLTEVDIQEAQLKSHMIRSAERVVALIDSSKFGKIDLTSFASIEQLSHILTDSHISSQFVEQIRQTRTVLTVCGENTVSSFTPSAEEVTHYKIGFANLSEKISFCIDVRRGLERAAQEAGHIDLIVADNQLNNETALRVAEHLLTKGVNLVIEYHIDEKISSLLINKFQQRNIPVIAVDIPIVGATYFGVDNYQAGYLAGVALGKWLVKHWQLQFDRLIVLEEPRAGALPAARIRGQLNGLQEVVGEISPAKIIYLDSGNTSEISEIQMISALKSLPDMHRLAILSFNDDAALGALAAARKVGREDEVVIVGQGADRRLREELRRPASRIIGSTAFMPEKYGEKLVPIALKILKGEAVPPAVYNDHIFIDAATIDLYYPE